MLILGSFPLSTLASSTSSIMDPSSAFTANKKLSSNRLSRNECEFHAYLQKVQNLSRDWSYSAMQTTWTKSVGLSSCRTKSWICWFWVEVHIKNPPNLLFKRATQLYRRLRELTSPMHVTILCNRLGTNQLECDFPEEKGIAFSENTKSR